MIFCQLFTLEVYFNPFTLDGITYEPGQGNNAYIFPGVGLGVIACRAKHVTDEMFLAAAQTLADEVTEDDFKRERIYPPLGHIREISTKIATTVCEIAYRQGLAVNPQPYDLEAFIKSQMYEPNYRSYV